MKLVLNLVIVSILASNSALLAENNSATESANKVYLSRSGGSANFQEIKKETGTKTQDQSARAQLKLSDSTSKKKAMKTIPLSRTGGSAMAISIPVEK